MKKRLLKSSVLSFAALAIAATLLLSSCQKIDWLLGNNQQNSSKIELQKTLLSAANEVPTNSSKGIGYVSGSYDTASMQLQVMVTWALGNPSDSTVGIHIHHGMAGVSGPIIIPFSAYYPTGSTGSFTTTTRALTDSEQWELKAGDLYLNIHSTTYPAGEMRTQLMLK